jgi:hypothetical protein
MAGPSAAETAAKAAAEAQVKANEDLLRKQQAAVTESAASATVVVHGREGGAYAISGVGFGGSKGTLTIGGRPIDITRWEDHTIRGVLPVGVRGLVELKTDSGTRYGAYPAPPPVPTATKVEVTVPVVTVPEKVAEKK